MLTFFELQLQDFPLESYVNIWDIFGIFFVGEAGAYLLVLGGYSGICAQETVWSARNQTGSATYSAAP